MADIKLGPSGAQTTLPDVIWPAGSAPELPYEPDSAVEEERMIDGSIRMNLLPYAPGTWPLVWDGITWADVETIFAAASINQQLVYTNEHTDNVDHNVVVKDRSYSLKGDTASTTPRYMVNLTLREIV